MKNKAAVPEVTVARRDLGDRLAAVVADPTLAAKRMKDRRRVAYRADVARKVAG